VFVRGARPDARARLFCFPYAGGGAAEFRALAPELPAGIDLCPVVFPGREHRLGEQPYKAIEPLVAALLEALTPLLRAAPFAFYGHSLGSFVAFELTRALRRARRPLPARLWVAARHAPHLTDPRPALGHLPDAGLLDGVEQRYGPIPRLIRDDPQILGLFLPVLRGDLTLLDRYVYRDEEPLDVPIEALRGTEDGVVTRSSMAAWAAHTRGAFRLHDLPGGHFFHREHRSALARVLAPGLEPLLA
jgi:medium-chain acyl-[acyl-carrier-protein] hydrolase